MTIQDFDTWRKEAERILCGWYRDDFKRVSKSFWRNRFDRGDRPWQAAHLAHDYLHHVKKHLLAQRGLEW